MRDIFIEELGILAAEDPDIILITGDLGFGVFEQFSENYPDQFLNVGVAEQNMTMVAAGMAIEGKKIFTYSIGNFPTLRCLEHIRNDICYHNLDVTIVSIGGGFSYGQLGMSHHATEDLSIMRALPNIKVLVPGTLDEVRSTVRAIVKDNGPAYLRLDKSFVDIQKPLPYEFGKASIIREGRDVSLISCGGILEESLKAAEKLSHEGINCRVISMHTLKPLDNEAIFKASEETSGIISIEENTIIGGLGASIAEVCLDYSLNPGFFKRIGLNDVYSTIVGDQYFLRHHYDMDSHYIVNVIKETISHQN